MYLKIINVQVTFTFYRLPFITISSAHLSPSIAEETIPPEYPAPSPQGYKPAI